MRDQLYIVLCFVYFNNQLSNGISYNLIFEHITFFVHITIEIDQYVHKTKWMSDKAALWISSCTFVSRLDIYSSYASHD